MGLMNRLGNAKNPHQGKYKKVLCVCSAGLLRSPTAAVVLSSEPFNYNTRACGVSTDYGLVVVDEVLVYWADEIVCMEKWHAEAIQNAINDLNIPVTAKIVVLGIEDNFAYRDPKLMETIRTNYQAHLDATGG